ncbi:MAG TPA: hypothetical protein VGD31_14350 [Sphingobacteriaceae bacterium]
MEIKFTVLLSVLLYLSGCSLDNSDCSAMCTTDFRYVTIKFSNSAGQPVVVNGYKSVNLRTGLQLQTPPPDTVHFKGIYIVASDSNILQLSTAGDTIQVHARDPKTDTEKTARFVVAGGECKCHITKKSGPEEIIFN